MARTIPQIKENITEEFLSNETIQNLYGVTPDRTFEAQFSKISLESILFHTVAACIWTLESLFDRHRQEVTNIIDELRPHTPRWYVNKTKAFQYGGKMENNQLVPSLINDTDQYDNRGKTEEQINQERIVKYAAVTEENGMVCVKVATGEKGNRIPLSPDQATALTAYLRDIKDAGVKLKIVNEPADIFDINIDIFYDSQILTDDLCNIQTTQRSVHDAIADFVENLPFNAEYRNSSLINTLLAIEGVVLVDLKQARANNSPFTARNVPGSGYFKFNEETSKITPISYDTASN